MSFARMSGLIDSILVGQMVLARSRGRHWGTYARVINGREPSCRLGEVVEL